MQEIVVLEIFSRQQFMEIINQAKDDSRPIQIKITRQEFNEEGKQLNNFLSFFNLSYIREYPEGGE